MAKWTEGKYAFWSADLGRGVKLSVAYDPARDEPNKPYTATVVMMLSMQLRERFATVKEAQAAAERAARQVLTRALAALDEGE